jgi:hypothetical protein
MNEICKYSSFLSTLCDEEVTWEERCPHKSYFVDETNSNKFSFYFFFT